jgi:hypothetical protein
MPLIKPKSKKDAEVALDKPTKPSIGIALQIQQQNKKKKSMHTRPDMSLDAQDDERSSSIAEAIVKKKAKMADGGAVADTTDDSDLDMDALGKENYDDVELTDIEDDQPEPTDMISRIRAKMKASK